MTQSPEKANFPTSVEVVAGDFDKPETLPAALAGVERVFVVPPGLWPRRTGPGGYLIAAAREAGVRHVVKFSTSGVSFDATDPLTSGHRAGEQVIQESDLDWTILRPGTFMIYLYGYADSIGKERTMYVTEGNPVSAMIHPRDIASVAAKVLTTSGHEGQTYTLTGGEALSPQRQGEIIGEALGQKGQGRRAHSCRDPGRLRPPRLGRPAPRGPARTQAPVRRLGLEHLRLRPADHWHGAADPAQLGR